MSNHLKVDDKVSAGILTILLLSVFVVGLWQFSAMPTASASTIFSDDYECPPNTAPATFTAWTGKSGAPTLQTSVKHDGSYAMATDAWNAYPYETVSATEIAAGKWFYFTHAPGESGSMAVMALVWTTTDGGVVADIYNDGGTLKWRITVSENDYSQHVDMAATPNPVVNTWYWVVIEYQSNTLSGATLHVDGDLVCNPAITTRSQTIDQYRSLGGATGYPAYSDGEIIATTEAELEPEAEPTYPSGYDYIMAVSGSDYLMVDGSTSETLDSSTDAKTVFDWIIGNATAGDQIYLDYGNVTVSTQWSMMGVNLLTLNFSSLSWLIAADDLNTTVFQVGNYAYHGYQCSNNITINGIQIDGNLVGQHITGGYASYPNGLQLSSSNNTVRNSTIANCRVHGITVMYNIEDIGYNTIINNTVSYIGWNGIEVTTGVYNQVLNNSVTHCGDVGITTAGNYTLVQGNICEDMDGSNGDVNSRWGLGLEGVTVDGQKYNTLNNNTIRNCGGWGIGSNGPAYEPYATITNNFIYNVSGVGISSGSNNTVIANNTIQYVSNYDIFAGEGTPAFPYCGIYLEGNNVYFQNNTVDVVTADRGNFWTQSSYTNNTFQDNTGLNGWYATALTWQNLTLTYSGSGSVGWSSGNASINTQTTDGKWQFLVNTAVSVTWTPDAGNNRVDFEVDGVNRTSTTSPQSITMDNVHVAKAYFENTPPDTDPPTFSDWIVNPTYAGQGVSITVTITDNVLIEQAILSWNNTGQWHNFTACDIYDTTDAYLLLDSGDETFNSTVGVVVSMLAYANDASGNWGVSSMYNVTLTDGSAPTFSAITGNTTKASGVVNYICTISDATGVSGYIPSWNNSGIWVNSTWVSGSSGSLIGTHNDTLGNTVSVKFYANDTLGNWGTSTQYNFVLTAPDVFLTVVNPENTTYTSSTIPNNASASGGTTPSWWSNIYNFSSSSYLYASNLTSANETVTLAVNGTYRIDFWANNTEGSTASANVTFTVAIPDTYISPELGAAILGVSATGIVLMGIYAYRRRRR